MRQGQSLREQADRVEKLDDVAAVELIEIAALITRFQQIFDVIPKMVVAKDLGMHYLSFLQHMKRPGMFTLEQMIGMAEMMEIPVRELVELAVKDVPE